MEGAKTRARRARVFLFSLCSWAWLYPAIFGDPAAVAAPKRIAITEVRGPNSAELAAAVERLFAAHSDEVELLGAQAVTDIFSQDGWKTERPDHRLQAAQAQNIDGFLSLETVRKRRLLSMTLTITNARSGVPSKRWQLQGKSVPGLSKTIKKQGWGKLRGAIATTEVPVSSDRRYVMMAFQGKTGKRLRSALIANTRDLPNVVYAGSQEAMDLAKILEIDIATPAGRAIVAEAYRVTGFIEGESVRKAKKYRASVTLYDGSTGEKQKAISDKQRTYDALELRLASQFRAMLEGGIEGTAPVPTAPPAADTTPGVAVTPEAAAETGNAESAPIDSSEETPVLVEHETEGPGPSRSRTRAAVIAQVGMQILSRNFSYTDDLFGELRPYSLGAAPALSAHLIWHPFSHDDTDNLLDVFGLDLQVNYGIGIESANADGSTFPTSSTQVRASLRGRIPLGRHEVAFLGGYGAQSFIIDEGVGNVDPGVPDVSYGYIRLASEGTYYLLESLYFAAHAGVRIVLGAGEVAGADWFPRASAFGFDVGAGVGYQILKNFEVRLSGDLEHYSLSMNSEPGDARVAGGATDMYLSGTLSLAFLL
jgi:hypothetical protein